MDEELRRELLARRDEDQRIRNLVSAQPGEYMVRLPDELAAQWQRIDEENTRWLAEVLSARGWPGQTLVGEDGAGAAWLLAQHADHDPVQQRAFLHALRSAAAQGQASRAHLAYLEDRVRVNADQPQLYGTQFTVTDGELGPSPIEDPERLDERRAEAGLEPFADYEARMRDRSSPSPAPANAGELGKDRVMKPLAASPVRIARPSHDLRAAERFWVGGLGLDVLFRANDSAEGGHALLMVGWPGAAWHLELVGDPEDATPAAPTEEDLLVLYLGGEVDEDLVSRLVDAGGTRVSARNPYWDRWGITIADPDGYRLVLSTLSWP